MLSKIINKKYDCLITWQSYIKEDNTMKFFIEFIDKDMNYYKSKQRYTQEELEKLEGNNLEGVEFYKCKVDDILDELSQVVKDCLN